MAHPEKNCEGSRSQGSAQVHVLSLEDAFPVQRSQGRVHEFVHVPGTSELHSSFQDMLRIPDPSRTRLQVFTVVAFRPFQKHEPSCLVLVCKGFDRQVLAADGLEL